MLKINLKQIIKFCISGGFAALANVLSRIFFSNFFSYEISILLSFLVGMITAFVLMQKYVFIFKRNSLLSQIMRFVFVNLMSLILTYIITFTLKYLLGVIFNSIEITELLAHIGGVSFPIFTSFIIHKYFTFQ